MTLILSGLAVGAVYALVALCLNIPYSNSGVFNFAQPQFVMLGAFVTYELVARRDVALPLVLALCVVGGGVLGYVEERLVIRPLAGRLDQAPLVTTVGASVVMVGVATVVWGTDPRSYAVPGSTGAVDLLGGRVRPSDLVLMVVVIAVGCALGLAAGRTRWGMIGQAALLDPELARLRGIDVTAVVRNSFVLAGAVAAGVGVLIGAKVSVDVHMGDNLVVLGFVALAVGGFGSYAGALVGGFLVGLLQVYTARYLGNDFPLLILLATLLVVLLVKPAGIFGRERIRSV